MTTNGNLHKFYMYANSLYELGNITNIDGFKNDISAFLLHMMHLKAYDFAKPFCEGKKVLEVGCNMGYGTKDLANISEEIVAIDFDSRALRIARENYAASNIRFKEADATALPFDINSFDVVIGFQVIEHTKTNKLSMFLSEICRVLKKNGIALLTTPNRKFRLHPFQRPCNLDHYTEYTVKSFLKKLRGVFENVEIIGLRAEEWIEEIEKNRINNSIYRAYVWGPLKTLLEVALPDPIVRSLKEMPIKSKLKPIKAKRVCPTQGDLNALSSKFSMDSLWFEKTDLDRSLYLLSINGKGTN